MERLEKLLRELKHKINIYSNLLEREKSSDMRKYYSGKLDAYTDAHIALNALIIQEKVELERTIEDMNKKWGKNND